MLFIQSFKNIFSFEFPRTFDGFHHFHLRFRKVDTFENKYHRYVDRSVYVTSVLFPLMTLPQIWEIFGNHVASGVSLSTWIWSALFTLYWLLYGIIHGDKAIMISSTIWTFINALVIFGTIIYS